MQLNVKEGNKAWTQPSSSSLQADTASVPQQFLAYHAEGRHHTVVDFDSHLSDIKKWDLLYLSSENCRYWDRGRTGKPKGLIACSDAGIGSTLISYDESPCLGFKPLYHGHCAVSVLYALFAVGKIKIALFKIGLWVELRNAEFTRQHSLPC